MPIFECSKCGCIENTAASNYVAQKYAKPPKPLLCSECDPEIGKWHGMFEKQPAKGLFLCDDGFLVSQAGIDSDSFKWRMEHQGLKVVREIQ